MSDSSSSKKWNSRSVQRTSFSASSLNATSSHSAKPIMHASVSHGVGVRLGLLEDLELSAAADPTDEEPEEGGEEGEAEAAASMLVQQLGKTKGWTVAHAVERIRADYSGCFDLGCGSVRTEHPHPGQAAFLPLFAPEGGGIVSNGFAALLPGTPLSLVAERTVAALAKVGLTARAVVLESRAPIPRLSKETMLLPCASWPSSALPVWRAKAWKSRSAPGSVVVTRNTCPPCIADRAFLAFKMGMGHCMPLVSISVSNCMVVTLGKRL